jgi:hypothetical protein
MADYFTKFSFVIPVTPEQGDWVAQVHWDRSSGRRHRFVRDEVPAPPQRP